MLIKLKEEIGEYCSQRQDSPKAKGGEFIRELIIKNWKNNKKIEISFEGVRLATPSFIDEAFGKLAIIYSLEQLKEKIGFLAIDEETKNKINKSIEQRLQQKEDKISYKDYEVEAVPYQLADSKKWKVNIFIWRRRESGAVSRNFGADNDFDTREEAVKNCFIFGEQIIDGKHPNLTVSDMGDDLRLVI